MLTFACLKIKPGFEGARNNGVMEHYVNSLCRQVRRHYSKPFNFVCMTDDAEGLECDAVKVHADWPTWWGKMHLYGLQEFTGRRVFYMDLDTIIVNNIDFIDEYDGDFAIMRNFRNADNAPFAAGILTFGPDVGRSLWDTWIEKPEAWMSGFRSDQEWLDHFIPLTFDKYHLMQDLWPGKFLSYNFNPHLFDKSGFKGAAHDISFAVFHGIPKPHKLRDFLPWVKEHWG